MDDELKAIVDAVREVEKLARESVLTRRAAVVRRCCASRRPRS
ncbi:hypothetical protein ACFQ0M_03750 [Kitasatospora aburaviensis]